MPNSAASPARIGVLLSGGVDSSVLAARLLERGWRVQPFYIRSGLVWEPEELAAAQRFLAALGKPTLDPLVTLELPLGDLYGAHWSVTGRQAPEADSPDDAVFLPGRNALLVVKAALWCQLHGVERLALACLRTNPFPDATPEFFDQLQAALSAGGPAPVEIARPFGSLDKRQVVALGRRYPLELTFSCIRPVDGRHCGQCNKCGERRRTFEQLAAPDPTVYAHCPAPD